MRCGKPELILGGWNEATQNLGAWGTATENDTLEF